MTANVATSRLDEVRGDVVIKRDSPFPEANLPANAIFCPTTPGRFGLHGDAGRKEFRGQIRRAAAALFVTASLDGPAVGEAQHAFSSLDLSGTDRRGWDRYCPLKTGSRSVGGKIKNCGAAGASGGKGVGSLFQSRLLVRMIWQLGADRKRLPTPFVTVALWAAERHPYNLAATFLSLR